MTDHNPEPYQVTVSNFETVADCLPHKIPDWIRDAIESELIRYSVYINHPSAPIKTIWLEFRQSGTDDWTEVPVGAYLIIDHDDKIRWTQRP